MFADISFGCEQQDFIIQQIDKNLMVNDATTFYQLSFFHEFDYWKKGEQGCCICMFLVYADKEDDIEPVIIEDDIPMKTTNPTQLKSISDDNSKVIKVKVNFLNHLKNGNLLCWNI